MAKLLQSGWVTMLLGTLLYLGVTASLLLKTKFPAAKHHSSDLPVEARSSAAWDFVNPEMDRLISELRGEKAALALRERQLAEWAARLEAERSEIYQATQAVYQFKRELEGKMLSIREEEPTKLKKLAKMYAAMSPEGAALIFKQMPDDQIVKILVFMKETETAPLLESFAKLGSDEAKRAALITDHLRTIIRPPSPKP